MFNHCQSISSIRKLINRQKESWTDLVDPPKRLWLNRYIDAVFYSVHNFVTAISLHTSCGGLLTSNWKKGVCADTLT